VNILSELETVFETAVVAVIAMTTKRSERISSLRYWPTITILRTTTVIRAKFALRPSARKYFKQSFILSVMSPERGGAVSGRTGADETLQEGSALGAVRTLNRIASGLMPMRMCFNRPVSN
jgi:hypothetical protein